MVRSVASSYIIIIDSAVLLHGKKSGGDNCCVSRGYDRVPSLALLENFGRLSVRNTEKWSV